MNPHSSKPRPIVQTALPLLALCGRPNVGKSTLFNRIVGGHHAIVEDQPGVTRDRRYGEAEYDGLSFRVVDTGGLDFAATGSIAESVLRQSLRAIEEAAGIEFGDYLTEAVLAPLGMAATTLDGGTATPTDV